MLFAHGETVQWRKFDSPGLDDYNNDIEAWDDPVPVEGCGFDPGGTQEPRDGSAQRVITTPVLYAPKGRAYGARDRFTVRGLTYEVEGDPADWVHPMTGWDPGYTVINLQRVEG